MQAPSYDPSYEDDLISEPIDDNVNTSTIIQKRRGRRPKVKENETARKKTTRWDQFDGLQQIIFSNLNLS